MVMEDRPSQLAKAGILLKVTNMPTNHGPRFTMWITEPCQRYDVCVLFVSCVQDAGPCDACFQDG